MEKYCYIEEKNISNIPSYILKKIIIRDSNKRKWAIKDSFKNTTPFFTNDDSNIITKSGYCCFFVGENEDGRNLYYTKPSSCKYSTIYEKIENIKDVNRIYNLENDYRNILLFINNDNEEEVCLFDTLCLKQKSDFFSSLYRSEYLKENSHLFLKKIKVANNIRKYIGEIDNNGKISKFIYDEHNDCFIQAPIIENDNYDIIDEVKLKQEIIKEFNPYNELNVSKEKIKNLVKLNR